ncbi:MAG: nucleotidyltransferase [Candidatus Omnitrophica bacterium]|nr:nucleotidyltransferase [Candidatus Omnitrophota bacterium]
MSKEKLPEPMFSALKDLMNWFKTGNCPGVIIGGIAVSFLARPRTTQDIDMLACLDEELWPDFICLGKKFRFNVRYKDALTFAKKNRVLLMRHEPTSIDIDISFGLLPFEEESLERAKKVRLLGITVTLPSPEDLVIMKAVAHRPIDLEDVRSILEITPKVDLKRIKRWVKEFANVLEMPEILDDLNKIITKNKK